MRKPYYKRSHKKWYVKIKGKDVALGRTEDEAMAEWARLVACSQPVGHPGVLVYVLASRFLSEQKGLVSEKRLELLTHYITAFVKKFGGNRCSDITKGKVAQWIGEQDTWGDWARHDGINCAKRMFNWAVEEEHMTRNPIKGLANPEPDSRQRVMTYDEHCRLVQAARESQENAGSFALYLIASRCGARPQLVRSVTAENVKGNTWVFAKHKTRHKTGKPQVVYLHPCLATICKMLLPHRKEGPLFRQDSGAAWSKDVAGRKFKRIRERTGIDSDVVLYTYRHTFATQSLMAGNSAAEVATLLGHVDTKMVSKTYGHLDQQTEHMTNAASRAFQTP